MQSGGVGSVAAAGEAGEPGGVGCGGFAVGGGSGLGGVASGGEAVETVAKIRVAAIPAEGASKSATISGSGLVGTGHGQGEITTFFIMVPPPPVSFS